MKPHIYTFTYIGCAGTVQHGTIEANGSTDAYNLACGDNRLNGCTILKSSFRREDTAKGAKRAGGLNSNGKQLDSRTAYAKAKEATCNEVENKYYKSVKDKAYKDFLKYLDKAITSLYLCDMENNGAVLSMPIKQLYEEMKNFTP